MNSEVPHTQLVIKRPNIQLSLEAKIYAGLFLLILSFIVGVLLTSFFLPEKPLVTVTQKSTPYKLNGTSSMKRLPLLIDRVVRDSSAYVYVKHASIRSELGIPWGKKIGLEEESTQTLELKGYK
ncbi:MAG: hypothetical protein KAG20_09700 [Cocleimonas sp.]|nr:hypothetical protein [Cocleimonas sp.]